ncbi:SDR family oxidoreductase [Mucilaginibacter robiniae]|uniref:SDR family oxidoreductase n=1 Tax=Mucilaginibacter robiniae TaxID=2728022 RepID=A0A7L5DUN0_9SPHI|nr:SDR family oxidoreductase [Mucilaginibacter robiniae]QJD94810.1 SDR family oxidoreductase [Mucilaginibacter robiniae]
MIVSVLGCGWFGFELAKALVKQGIRVNGSTTSSDKLAQLSEVRIHPYLIALPSTDTKVDEEFYQCDVLVIAIPPKSRSGEDDLYVDKMKSIIQAATTHQIKRVILISSTGVYANSNRKFTETDEPMPDTASGKILLQAEKLFLTESSFQTSIIRFGGLVGPGRDPGRFFAGKQDVPNGQAPVNLIHQNDCVSIALAVITQPITASIIDACSPHHPPKQEFYKMAAARSGLPLPTFVDELQSWKIVDSQVLTYTLHYQFQVDNWFAWLTEA